MKCLSWSIALGYIAKKNEINVINHRRSKSKRSVCENNVTLTKGETGTTLEIKKNCAKKEQKPGIPQKLRFINGLVYDDMDFTNCFLSQSVMNKKK